MGYWNKPLWHNWTIDFPVLCELKLEMEYKISRIRQAYNDLEFYMRNNPESLAYKLQFPDFLLVDKVRVLHPSHAPDIFIDKLNKLDNYLQPEFEYLAQAIYEYFREYQLQHLLAGKRDKDLLIAGLRSLADHKILDQHSQANNLRPSSEEFIQRLMSGKYVRNMFYAQRIHYAVLLFKMRCLLCRGGALKPSYEKILEPEIKRNNPLLKGFLTELDIAAKRNKPSYRL